MNLNEKNTMTKKNSKIIRLSKVKNNCYVVRVNVWHVGNANGFPTNALFDLALNTQRCLFMLFTCYLASSDATLYWAIVACHFVFVQEFPFSFATDDIYI